MVQGRIHMAHLVSSLRLVYQALNHETINIFGDGSVVRDFIFIDDAIQAVLDVIKSGETNATYNVGRGIGHIGRRRGQNNQYDPP